MTNASEQLYPQARRFTGSNGTALATWVLANGDGRHVSLGYHGPADVSGDFPTDAIARGVFTVGPNDANAHQTQQAHPGDWIVLDGPGQVRVDDRAPDGGEARALAVALLSLAHAAGMPGSFWQSDSRIAIACETLDITCDQARGLSGRNS